MAVDLVVQTNTEMSLIPDAFQKNGYLPIEALTYEQWATDGKFIEAADGSVAWWIGDWMNYGEKTYGDEKYKQAMEMTGFEYQTINNYRWVASKVQFISRNINLSFAHHHAVAKYEPEQQSLLLGKAAELGLSVKEFRKQIPRLLLVLPENVHIFQADFYERVQEIEADSINLIVTDPPYNISSDNVIILQNHKNQDRNFGQWDNLVKEEFISLFHWWAQEWTRILKPNGSGYVFTSDRYISHLRDALEDADLHVKASITWHKTNPGTQPVKTNFKSSVEYILFFTKGEGGHTFHWQGENEMHNFIQTPICAGNERIKGENNETLHPTQKPEALIKHLMTISSNPGDMVFDGFAGVGTTGKVAIEMNCGFIGIEQEEKYFLAMEKRLAE
jgi:DNA modification methylase